MDAKILKRNVEFRPSKPLESYFRVLCNSHFLLVVKEVSQVWGWRREKTEEEEEDKEERG